MDTAKEDPMEYFEVDGQNYSRPTEKHKAKLMIPTIVTERLPVERIWRYMSLDRLVYMLRTKSLYFPRVDQLGPLEGSFSKPIEAVAPEIQNNFSPEELEKFDQSFRQLRQNTMQRMYFASCWHADQNESNAMWALYGPCDHTIAINSTVGDLCGLRPELVQVSDIEFIPKTWIGDIEYIDYLPDDIPEDTLTLLFKPRIYRADQEIRSIIKLFNYGWSQHERKDLPLGLKVPIEPNRFIKQVIMPPRSTGDFNEIVKATLDRFECTAPVTRSWLDREPVW